MSNPRQGPHHPGSRDANQARADSARGVMVGRRILVTQPEDRNGTLLQHLSRVGAVAVVLPTVQIVPPADFGPLDAAISRLAEYDWVVFTSVNGVRFFMERLLAAGRTPQALQGRRLAATGPVTARALAAHGLQAEFVPERFVAEAIVGGIGDVAGLRFLLPRADIARKALVERLEAMGAQVDDVVAYRTVPIDKAGGNAFDGELPQIDIATFTSPSTIRNFAALFGDRSPAEVLAGVVVACIGPVTAAAAQELGLPPHVVAGEHTVDGLVDAIVDYLQTADEETRT